MLRRALMAALAVGTMAAGLPRGAEAVVTYTLTDQAYGIIGSVPPLREQRTGLAFTVSDAAVARGAFQLSFASPGAGGEVLTGNVADLVSIVALDQTIAPGSSFVAGSSSLAVTFGADRSVSSLALVYRGSTEQLFLTSTAPGVVSGTYGSDFNNCGFGPPQCTVSGRLVASVPEPMSLALLGMGLLGMAVLRRSV